MNRTIKIRFNRNGEVKKIVGNVGRTRMNLAAYHLHRGDIQPTFGAKLVRFFRRLNRFIKLKPNTPAITSSEHIGRQSCHISELRSIPHEYDNEASARKQPMRLVWPMR